MGAPVTIGDWLFDPAGLTPHGFCLTWAPGLLWLHATSDAVVALAYFSIPLALIRFVQLRRDLAYHWIAYLFGGFILACGMTHVMAIYTLWVPAYGVEGLIKVATAILSIATAAILWPLVPRLVALPSPASLRELNARLSDTVVEQARTAALLRDSELELRGMNAELERRVAERTADLTAANARLTQALAERTATETALRESETRLRLAIGAAKLGLAEVDFEADCGRIDARTASMTGSNAPVDAWIKLGGPISVDWRERIHPDDLSARDAAIEALNSGEVDTAQMDYRMRQADGTWNTVTHWRAVVERDPDGPKPRRAVSIFLDTTERARVEAELRAALGQRDLLLREVYHRVKNNLQIVDGLLVLNARSLKDPAAVSAIEGLRSRIYALGLVHAQLMTSKNLETFDLAPFLAELAPHIVAGAGDHQVPIEIEAAPPAAHLDFAVPLGLLVTELVTNSLKHAFPHGAGTIRVTLASAENRMVALTVADDGPGGGGTEVKSGVGASIVEGLVRQISGQLSIDSDGGRTTRIVAPQPEPT